MKVFGNVLMNSLVKKVLLASIDEANGNLEDGDEGAHDPQGGCIYIHDKWLQGADAHRARETIAHEIVHALLDASGVRVKLRTLLGVSDARWEEIEEEIVLMLTPAYLSSLASAFKVLAIANVRRVIGSQS